TSQIKNLRKNLRQKPPEVLLRIGSRSSKLGELQLKYCTLELIGLVYNSASCCHTLILYFLFSAD
ncbi:25364_t:CDS:1, partial [Gigaspora rosea]